MYLNYYNTCVEANKTSVTQIVVAYILVHLISICKDFVVFVHMFMNAHLLLAENLETQILLLNILQYCFISSNSKK